MVAELHTVQVPPVIWMPEQSRLPEPEPEPEPEVVTGTDGGGGVGEADGGGGVGGGVGADDSAVQVRPLLERT